MKRKLLLSVFVAFLAMASRAQVLLHLSNDTLRPYVYGGGDEFNQPAINQNDWSLLPWPKTNMGQFFSFDAHNVTLENGLAVFSLKEKDSLYTISAIEVDSSFIKKRKITLNDHQYRLKYTAGIIISKQKYHYGLYELRFKVEEGKGVWPSFWFYGGKQNDEIDAFELKGERNNEIHVDTHCPYGCDRGYKNKLGFNTNWGNWMPVSNYLHEGFNIMLLDWKPGEITWYINGYPLAYFKGDFPNPMNLYLNTQVASEFSAFKPGPDATTPTPNNFYVDYLRVWKSTKLKDLIKLEVQKNAEVSDRFVSDYKNKSKRHSGLMYKKKKFRAAQGMISLSRISEDKITVNVLGDLNEKETSVEFKGQFASYKVTETGKETTLTIDSREKELELMLITGDKSYSQKISLRP